jgi:hypothetical protein
VTLHPGGLRLLFGELAESVSAQDPDTAGREAARRHGVIRVGPTLPEKLGLTPPDHP